MLLDGRKNSYGLIETDRSAGHTYEQALIRTGYGRFHYKLLFLCGWAVASDSIEVLCVSFLLPSAECDLKLTSIDKGWLNAIIFVGMMVGGYVWGALADIQGRRAILMFSLALNGLAALASSCSQTFWLFLLLRFFSGVGVGGSVPVIFSYFVEFQPKDRRGRMISLLATFWMGGNIIAAGLAWAVIPHKGLGYFSPEFTYDSWRIFIALCTIPSLTSALAFVLMPESPKFLLMKGNDQEALKILNSIYLSTHKDLAGYEVKQLLAAKDDDREESDLVLLQRQGPCSRGCARAQISFKKYLLKTKKLFTRPLARSTVTLIFIQSSLAFGYYGLFLWFPELFKRMEEHGGSACDAALYVGNKTVPLIPSNQTCGAPPDANVFFEGFLTAISTLPSNIFAILVMDKIGAKIILVISMGISGLSVFFIWLVKNKTQGIIMSCIFSGISNAGWSALDVLSVECFPTDVRSTAMGTGLLMARIAAILGNLAFGALVDAQCAVPMLLVAALLCAGGFATLILPNKRMQEID
ncbi:synaptic vesicle glycoprotein 2C-like isoform X2 [Lineus longissimus]|uniref:synaptic vesicle glycoprotein 2C-like isoform X2 n=1 Tax=Lineus longissimus TaxID=88925 RepID=UPI002B4F8CD9